MTAGMPDSVERPVIFERLEQRYADPATRGEALDALREIRDADGEGAVKAALMTHITAKNPQAQGQDVFGFANVMADEFEPGGAFEGITRFAEVPPRSGNFEPDAAGKFIRESDHVADHWFGQLWGWQGNKMRATTFVNGLIEFIERIDEAATSAAVHGVAPPRVDMLWYCENADQKQFDIVVREIGNPDKKGKDREVVVVQFIVLTPPVASKPKKANWLPPRAKGKDGLTIVSSGTEGGTKTKVKGPSYVKRPDRDPPLPDPNPIAN